MNPKIKQELNRKNAMIVGGTLLVVFFWKELLILGVIAGIGWLIWKNRFRIKKYWQNSY